MKNAKAINGKSLYPVYEGSEKVCSIHYDSRAVREANKAGIIIYKQSGGWNGYGYETLDRFITASDAAKIRKTLKKIDKKNEKRKPAKILTAEEKIEKWAKRLDGFTGCGIEQAREIAREKIDYELEHLEQAMNADYSGWKIPVWKKQAERAYDKAKDDESKLLKAIKGDDHARAILAASHRHNNTDYETRLEEARDMGIKGEEVKEYARANFS